jgi:hypothetical protein
LNDHWLSGSLKQMLGVGLRHPVGGSEYLSLTEICGYTGFISARALRFPFRDTAALMRARSVDSSESLRQDRDHAPEALHEDSDPPSRAIRCLVLMKEAYLLPPEPYSGYQRLSKANLGQSYSPRFVIPPPS